MHTSMMMPAMGLLNMVHRLPLLMVKARLKLPSQIFPRTRPRISAALLNFSTLNRRPAIPATAMIFTSKMLMLVA